MAVEVEVVEVAAANSLLPNLTICVEKEEDEKIITDDPDDEEKQNKGEDSKEMDQSKAEVKLNLDQFPRKKLYENKKLAGLGLSFEEAKKKREERAKRFASPLVREQEEEENLENYKQKAELALQRIQNFNSGLTDADKDQVIRENALHMQGVDNMSTDEIFSYFGRMDPTHIEWINDTSCNVIWNDDKSASISLLKVTETKPENKEDVKKQTEISDDLDLDMDIDQSLTEDQDQSEKTKTENPPQDVPVNPLLDCKEPFVKDEQGQFLKVRFATGSDRKTLGAAKRSKYYVEYGNPHYGGEKGLFSGSYRKKYQMRSAMKELQGMKVGSWYTRGQKRGGEFDNMSKAVKSDIEKDDETLIKSSAKDLDDAIPVNSDGDSSDEDGDDKKYGGMVADKVAKQLKSARSMSRNHRSELTVTTSNSNVKSRLGKRRHDNHERSPTRRRDVLERLPNDLRNRLGRKTNSSSSTSSSRRHGNRNDSPSRRRSPDRPDAKKSRYSSPMSREMTRYSPPPWE